MKTPECLRQNSSALYPERDPVVETAANSTGRNTLFELALAAEWRRAGVNAAIGEPDIQLAVGSQQFLVECKRPFTWKKISRSLSDAKKQLRNNGALPNRGAPKGVIAISLSRIIAEGQRFMQVESPDDKKKLGELMDRELSIHNSLWRSQAFDDSVAAILFHLSLPADVGRGEYFKLLSFSNAYQAGPNPEALQILNSIMAPLHKD